MYRTKIAAMTLAALFALLVFTGCSSAADAPEGKTDNPSVLSDTETTDTGSDASEADTSSDAEALDADDRHGESSSEPSDEEKVEGNPLKEKEYEPLVYDTETDFREFIKTLSAEWSDLIIDFSDYISLHGDEIQNNMGFADFDDYVESFDPYYEFLEGVVGCSSDNVPEEYKEAWGLLKTTIAMNKAQLDKLYSLKGQDLLNGASEMLTNIEVGAGMVTDAMPAE